MNNLILGSGVVGLLARVIFGPTWKIIPFYKSRFFSYNPALDDNFIIADKRIEDCINDLGEKPNIVKYKRVWSINGLLYKEFDKSIYQQWLTKIFGNQLPTHSSVYLNQNELSIYDIRINQLYQNLLASAIVDLKTEANKGIITEIGDHYIIRNGKREEFDNIISTIPLDVLYKLMNVKFELHSRDIQYLHIETNSINFEGANQSLVVDNMFSFYKVTNVAPKRYLFYCHEEIPNPGIYLMPIIGSNFEILDGTSIKQALPLGPNPKLDFLESRNIYCVGSYAQWDWCMDISSCILRLMKMAHQNFKLRTYIGL